MASPLLIANTRKTSTCRLRELQWKIDWFSKCYAEAKTHNELAWKIYNDAIDSGDDKDTIYKLFEVAAMFEDIRIDAYRNLDQAKAQYLAMLN